MFLKFVLYEVLLFAFLLMITFLSIKVINKHREYKKLEKKEQRKKNFIKKMKELEIK